MALERDQVKEAISCFYTAFLSFIVLCGFLCACKRSEKWKTLKLCPREVLCPTLNTAPELHEAPCQQSSSYLSK